MSEMDSHLKIAVASIRCFADDGTLDLGELNYLLGIATADGVIDDEEKHVLASIMNKVEPADVSSVVMRRIEEVRRKYSF